MIDENRYRIISDDYADLLVVHRGSIPIGDYSEDQYVNVINYFQSVIHIPVSEININTITQEGYSVMPSLYGLISQAALERSGITRVRAIPNLNLRGQGVLIGFIDSGIDYTNPIFRHANGATRILSIWDQTINEENNLPFAGYGTIYSRDEIDLALRSENPLQIVPSMDEIGHGTMMAGIAAGNEVFAEGFAGVAPEAELVVVKLKEAKPYLKEFFMVPPSVNCYQENDILFGLEYLLKVAAEVNRPIVICIGLGTSQGAHDGRGTLSGYLSYVSRNQGVGIVVAAGNEGNARRHYFGSVSDSGGYDTIELNVGENEYGFSMEIWGNSPGIYTLDLLTPSGEYIPRMGAQLDENREISFIFEETIIYIDFQSVESQSGDQLILIRFRRPAPGIWRFRVYREGQIGRGFNVWLPMQGFISPNTYFLRSDPNTTILSLGNGMSLITVTGYNDVDDSFYLDSSRGYARNGIIKPDIAAPSVGMLSPNLQQGFSEVTGTSAGCAFAGGTAALLMEWGVVRGNYILMNTVDLKAFFIRGARRNPDITYPNREWGYGILDLYSVLDHIRGDIIGI